MTKKFLAFAAVAVVAIAGSVNAATVTTRFETSPVSPEAIAAGAPAGGLVNKYFLTSDADVLAVDRVGMVVGGANIFQVAPPFGADNEPPAPAFIALNRALEADTWVSTPGATSLLGPGLPGDGSLTTFGDLTNDGAQTEFQFAAITTGDMAPGTFNLRIQLAGATGPELFEFSLPINIPEPATLAMAGLGLIGMVAVSRRK
jgi:hypothetical protein